MRPALTLSPKLEFAGFEAFLLALGLISILLLTLSGL